MKIPFQMKPLYVNFEDVEYLPLKLYSLHDDKDDFICGGKSPEPLIVKENGANFAKCKTLLNTFLYTGTNHSKRGII